MSMKKPQFETNEGTENAAPEASPTTAVAAPATSSVAVVGASGADPLAALQDKLHVEYDTLTQVKVSPGSWLERETEESLGDTIVLKLLSWQDSYVCSPNDDSAEIDLVKYSDDGVTSKDGVNMQDHLARLKADGYEDAKISQRMILVGALKESGKSTRFLNKPVQIDLPPTSRKQFVRYRAETAYAVSEGLMDGAKALVVEAKIVQAKGKGTNRYSMATFSAA